MKKTKNYFAYHKGVWEYVYVFFKLIADAKLQIADKDGNPNQESFCKVLTLKYDKIVALIDEKVTFGNARKNISLPQTAFKDYATLVFYNLIHNNGIENKTFCIFKIKQLLHDIGYTPLAITDSCDHTIKINDIYYGVISAISPSPTLLNASSATNFIFELEGLTKNDVRKINNIVGYKKNIRRCEYIKRKASRIRFVKYASAIFENNLTIIDDGLPEIVASCVYAYYFEDSITSEAIVRYLNKKNPRNYSGAFYYEGKFKRFLCSIALGMNPKKIWNDENDALGGYIIMNINGELSSFSAYNRTPLMKYLYTHTYFEKASSTRHGYMNAYESDGKVYIKLNLQIRFKS